MVFAIHIYAVQGRFRHGFPIYGKCLGKATYPVWKDSGLFAEKSRLAGTIARMFLIEQANLNNKLTYQSV